MLNRFSKGQLEVEPKVAAKASPVVQETKAHQRNWGQTKRDTRDLCTVANQNLDPKPARRLESSLVRHGWAEVWQSVGRGLGRIVAELAKNKWHEAAKTYWAAAGQRFWQRFGQRLGRGLAEAGSALSNNKMARSRQNLLGSTIQGLTALRAAGGGGTPGGVALR